MEVLKKCATADDGVYYIAFSSCGLGHSEFQTAYSSGHKDIIKFFLGNSKPQHCKHRHGFSHLNHGLWVAAEHGWLLATKLLLNYGASVDDDTDANGRRSGSVIFWAVKSGNADVVVLLLAYGAKVPVLDGDTLDMTIQQMAQRQSGTMARIIEQATKQLQNGQNGNGAEQKKINLKQVNPHKMQRKRGNRGRVKSKKTKLEERARRERDRG